MSKSFQVPDKSVSFEDISRCFSLPLSDAADALGIPSISLLCLLVQKTKKKNKEYKGGFSFLKKKIYVDSV